jgi:cytochrome c oxidase assembly protein subunit 15
MTSFLRSDRSTPVAIWLWLTAVVVFLLLLVGGVTRLTDSGLSITQWRPIAGVLPPLSHDAWVREFSLYQQIPQYRLVNPDMTVDSFRSIYWWEWSHRFLARAVGLLILAPLAVFLARRQIPRRLTWPCVGLLVLVLVQGLVGWLMVKSGLTDRVTVLPERLMTHLGLALLMLVALVWIGLSAFYGLPRIGTASTPWKRAGLVFLIAVYAQCLLGALVAGNRAGKVDNDWPFFNGKLWPQDYAGDGLWSTLAHNPASVQAHHRLLAYAVFVAALAIGAAAARSRVLARDVKLIAAVVALAALCQLGLGVATLMTAVPVSLGAAHQAGGALLLSAATVLAWRVRRV